MESLVSSHELEMGLGMIKNVELKEDRPADKELRVLMFTAAYFVLDGVTLTIRRLESHLRANGAVVKILTTIPDDIADPKQIEHVIPVPGIKIPFADAGTGYAFGVGLDENIIREVERFNPTCVHFTVPDFVALDGIRWCQRNNVAYIATWHSNYVDYLKYYFLEWVLGPAFHRYLKGFYEQIPAVYIPTPYMLKKMESEGFGSCTQLKEWGRGVDLKIFSPDRRSDAWRSSKNMTENDVVILWVGRLVPEKRPDIWLSVVRRLQLEGIAVKALVVGHGTFETSLAQLKNVSCCGWLSGVALAEAYACADVLLFPSDVETFGNVTLEALSSGCACVVEDKCGGHLVEHGKNGFTCPAGDFESFYQATKKIATDAVLRKEMGKYARESAWKFERTKIMQQMAENYKDAIVRHRDPSFIKRHLQQSPEASGRNFLAFICCNYWFVKTFAEPFLNTSQGVQNLVHGTTECVHHSRSRLNCADGAFAGEYGDYQHSSSSRFEDERKGRNVVFSSNTSMIVARTLHYATLAVSYGILAVFIFAAFTLGDSP